MGIEFYGKSQEVFWSDLKSGEFTALIQESAISQHIGAPGECYNIMKPIFAKEPDVEKMYGIFTNRKNGILSISLLATGSISSAAVYPREIVKKLLAEKACGLILVHNHPGGDPSPSSEDRAITKRIMIPTTCIGVEILDHIIIGGASYFSFAGDNLLRVLKAEVDEILRS